MPRSRAVIATAVETWTLNATSAAMSPPSIAPSAPIVGMPEANIDAVVSSAACDSVNLTPKAAAPAINRSGS